MRNRLKINKSPFVIIWVVGSIFYIIATQFLDNIPTIEVVSVCIIVIGMLGTVLNQKKESD